MSSHTDETLHKTLVIDRVAQDAAWVACLVVLQGGDVGNKILLNKDKITIGRGKDVDVRLTQGGVSRMHADIQRLSEQRFVLTDHDSTNGTLVNNVKISARQLIDHDLIMIGDCTLKFIACDNPEQAYYDELYRQTQMDKAIQVYNKHYFLGRLDEEITRCRQSGGELALVLFDVDRFKRLNDTHGHLAGDAALLYIAETGKQCLRGSDVLCRYGGEEFGVIMPGTPPRQAHDWAENLRNRFAQTPWSHDDTPIAITISAGVSHYSTNEARSADREALIAQADKALYQAKRSGRNRVVLFGA